MIRVLFVCTGNICRSPIAEGVFRQLVAEHGLTESISADSAGTIDYHAGESPDRRAQAAARSRGIDLSGLRARQIRPDDFDRFDHILVMDEDNFTAVRAACPPARLNRIRRFLDYAPHLGTREVPDPYYGGPKGFESVLDLCTAASTGLLESLRESPS